jgi:CPA2 family monovalent cation:H+ antiporter-2
VPHETALIATISVSLAFAFVGGFLAIHLRLPPLVGYLLAGIAVGPFTPGFIADAPLASELAEIGVMLLMFGVGMHFSLSDLLAVRSMAVPGAVLQLMVATGLGVTLTALWHSLAWRSLPSLPPPYRCLALLCRYRQNKDRDSSLRVIARGCGAR